jgi:transcriptional regulator with PAS, ATPase and Fis domain
MVVMSRRQFLDCDDLPPDLLSIDLTTKLPGETETGNELESLQRRAILDAIERYQGNRTRAASALGISVRTLQRKLKAWGLASEV